MPLDLSTKCSKCNKVMALDEIRALGGGKFICRGCLEGTQPRNTISEKPKEEKIKERTFFEKKEYVCDDCHYKFSRNSDVFIEKCPFCGKPNVHEKIEKFANELLDEDDDF